MSGRSTDTAISRLERILLLLPRAQQPEGVRFDELEALFEVDRRTLRKDLELLTSRAAYLRAGDPANLQITIDPDRVHVFSPGVFDRPPRLGTREAIALLLGLRSRALLRGHDDDAADRLVARLEGVLSDDALEDLDPLPVEDASARAADGRFRDRALDAITGRTPVSFTYLKPGADAPEARRLNPLTVIHAEGHWYLMGEDPEAPPPAIRSFRIDRILELELDDAPFAYPESWDPEEYLSDGRAFHAREAVEVAVDYSPRIGRWIEERFHGERLEDGGLRVVHRVADREWLVRHVLQYGGDAVAHPPGRSWVVEALESAAASPGNRSPGRGMSVP